MSRSKFPTSVLALLTLVTVATIARGQHTHPLDATPQGVTTSDGLFSNILRDPFELPHDGQFFAPAELGDFGEPLLRKTGFFATYDRMYISVSRPESGPFIFAPLPDSLGLIPIIPRPVNSHWTGDFGWGNRFEVGYATPNGATWMVGLYHMDGPNNAPTTRVEQLDFNPADPQVDPADTQFIPDFNQILLVNSINVATVSNVEFNRYFHTPRLYGGGYLEPYLGIRYDQFTDFTYNASVDHTITLDPATPAGVDQVIRTLNGGTKNQMLGGQVGLRWSADRGRWSLSSSLAMFAMHNWQDHGTTLVSERILFSALISATESQNRIRTEDRFSNHDSEFVFGPTVRAQAALKLTRDISVRFGFDMIDYVQGIGRGPSIGPRGLPSSFRSVAQLNGQSTNIHVNNEDVLLIGGTIGLEINR